MARARAKRPSRKDDQVGERGLEALTLAREDQARIEPRLPAGLLDGLGTDLDAFGQLVPGALQSRAEKRAATVTQNTAAGTAAALIGGIRLSVTHAGLKAGVRKAWGVGGKVNARVVKTVRAAGEQILARAAAEPDEVRAAGILPRDLEALRAALDGLSDADATQEAQKITAKSATAARNAAGRRIEAATRRIAAAGALELAAEPQRAARYEALLKGPAKRRKPAAPTA